MGCSHYLTGAVRVVVGLPRVPSVEQWPERAIQGASAGLQQQRGAAPGPLHLLALGEALLTTALTVLSAMADEMRSPARSRSPSLIRLPAYDLMLTANSCADRASARSKRTRWLSSRQALG